MFNETFFLLLLFRYFFFAFIIIQSLAWVIFSFFFFFNPSKIEKRKTGKKNYNNFSFSRPVSKRQGSIDNLYIYIIRRQNWFQNESSCYSFERVTCFRLMSRWWKKKEKKRKEKNRSSIPLKIIRWKMFRRWMKYDHRSNIDHEEERWMVKDTFQNPLALLFARNENEKIRLGSSLARGQSSENYTRVCKYICSFDTRCRHPLNSRLSLLGVMKQKPIGLQSQLSK